MRNEDRRGDGLASGILMGMVFVCAAPIVFYALAYAFFYVVCSLDPCFTVGL